MSDTITQNPPEAFPPRTEARLGALLEGAAVIVFVGQLLLAWRDDGRLAKFVRAAFLWLFVSFAMLLLSPLYRAWSGIPFSHAYYGAVRHAITVGFISMMIVGMAARTVPRLRGLDPRPLPALWSVFLLLNSGCLLRVLLQVSTDWHPGVFPFLALGGALEGTALALWSAHLLAVILGLGRYRTDPNTLESICPPESRRTTPDCPSEAARSELVTFLGLTLGSVWPAAILHASHNLYVQAFLDRVTVDSGPTHWWAGEFSALAGAQPCPLGPARISIRRPTAACASEPIAFLAARAARCPPPRSS